MIVNTYYAPEILGGAEMSVKKLAEQLTKEGNKVTVLCSGTHDMEENVDGVRVIRIRPVNFTRSLDYEHLPVWEKVVFRWKIYFQRFVDTCNIFNYRKLSRYIDEIKPDVIHTNCLYEITPIIWKVAKDKNIPVIHTLRDFYLICKYGTLKNPSAAEMCQKQGIKCKIRRKIAKRCLNNWTTQVTAPSMSTIDVFKNNAVLDDSKGVCIPNAIDFDMDTVKKAIDARIKNIDNKIGISFVYLGTLTEFKGVKWLVESFMKLENPNTNLFIAGKGPLAEWIDECSKKDNRIHFVGFLKEDKMNELLKECDVLVCPSLWSEPFGRVVLDAYKSGLPVIASNQGALSEVVDDGKTGVVVDADEKESLYRVMGMISDNIDILSCYLIHLTEKLQSYSIENQSQSFVRLYREV